MHRFSCRFDRYISEWVSHFNHIETPSNDPFSQFQYLLYQMPDGVTRDNTVIHALDLKILNELNPKLLSPGTLEIIHSLWGLPGDDTPVELDQISVDISYHFNRLNKRLWAPPNFSGRVLEKPEQKGTDRVEQERIVTEQSVPVNEQKTEGITYVPYREGLTPDDLFGVTPDISF